MPSLVSCIRFSTPTVRFVAPNFANSTDTPGLSRGRGNLTCKAQLKLLQGPTAIVIRVALGFYLGKPTRQGGVDKTQQNRNTSGILVVQSSCVNMQIIDPPLVPISALHLLIAAHPSYDKPQHPGISAQGNHRPKFFVRTNTPSGTRVSHAACKDDFRQNPR